MSICSKKSVGNLSVSKKAKGDMVEILALLDKCTRLYFHIIFFTFFRDS